MTRRVDFLHNLILEGPGNTGAVTHVLGVFDNLPSGSYLIMPATPEVGPGLRRIFSKTAPATKRIRLQNLAMNLSLAWTYLRHIRRNGRPDVIYSRGLLPLPAILALVLRRPFVFELNGVRHKELVLEGHGRATAWVAKRFVMFNARRAAAIVAVSSDIKSELCHLGIPECKITVLENGVDDQLFSPMDTRRARAELDLDQELEYVVHVGSLLSWQGLTDLLPAFKAVSESHPRSMLLLVGDGPQRGELEELSRDLGIADRVQFVGHIPHALIPTYIAAATVCVAPKTVAASPLKLVEYLACSRPVVASDLPGFKFVEAANAGYLVPPHNVHHLARAIMHMLQSGPTADELGRNGWRFVVRHRTWRQVAERTAEICGQLATPVK